MYGLGLMGLLALGNLHVPAPDFRSMVQDKLKDLHMDVRSDKVRLGELRKINNDFANAYRFSNMEAFYKEPSRLRLESVVLGRKIVYVINGDMKYVKAPGHSSTDNVAQEPGKKQTMLDFGIITPSLASRVKPRYLREEKLNGQTLYVYELTWNYGDDESRHEVWMDPKTKITVKRVWYNQKGKLMATFNYLDPVEAASGVWIPTKVEVYNRENKFGGRTLNSNIRVNKGMDDNLFKL